MTQLTILTPAEKRQLDSPPQFTQQDRQRYFFMSGQLRSIVSRIRRQDNKIGFVLQWGYFCSRARFYPADQFKQRDIAYVKRLFKCDDVDLSNYAGTVVTRHRHRILETLDWQEADETDREQLYQQALRQARHQDFPQDIFSALVDTCWKQQIVVPSYRSQRAHYTKLHFCRADFTGHSAKRVDSRAHPASGRPAQAHR